MGEVTDPSALISGCIAEVDAINRQKFLAELSKLLTFMYEEDRQRALSMYERMFDIAEDEQGLIQHLMSPTRQAVIIARAYDAKDRKLSVSSQVRGDSGETEAGSVPKFVLVINKVFDDLFPDQTLDEADDDQISFIDLGLAEQEDFSAAKPQVPPGAVLLSDTQQFRLEDAGVADTAEDIQDDFPAAAAESPESFTETDSIDELISSWKRDLEAEAVPADAALPEEAEDVLPQADPVPAPVTAAEEAPPAPDDSASAGAEVVPEIAEADMPSPEASFSEDGDEELLPEEEAAEAAPVFHTDDPEASKTPDGDAHAADVSAEAAPGKATPVQERSVPKLVLFLIPALPLTLALFALLLVPALLFLGVSLALIALGATLAVSAFSGLSMLADLLLLLGAALVALALGLLFLWLFVWVIGSGMGGLIRLVRRLGRQFCMKEVTAV